MVDRSELITICRQIGGMMQAGVDILRITRVLRAQTDNPRLLQLYDALDHDLTMGRSLVDAMERAPDVWSPFIVSLVQQGEDRNDIAGAFLSSADYLQKEGELEASTIASGNEPGAQADGATPRNEYSTQYVQAPAVVSAVVPPESLSAVVEALIARLQSLAVFVLLLATALSLAWAVVWWFAGAELLPLRWVFFALCSVAALIFGGAGVWLQNVVEDRRSSGPQFSSSAQSDEQTTGTTDSAESQTDENRSGAASPLSAPSGAAVTSAPDVADQSATGDAQGVAGATPSAENVQPVAVEQARVATESRPLSQNGTTAPSSARVRTRQAEEDYE